MDYIDWVSKTFDDQQFNVGNKSVSDYIDHLLISQLPKELFDQKVQTQLLSLLKKEIAANPENNTLGKKIDQLAAKFLQARDFVEALKNSPREEQNDLLQYASYETLQKIYENKQNPMILTISDQINCGTKEEWVKFLEYGRNQPDSEAHYLLLAAYCFGHITHTSFATAFIFLNLAIDDEDYKIEEVTVLDLPPRISNENFESIAKNERFCITIREESISPQGRILINIARETNTPGLINGDQRHGLYSFAIEKYALDDELNNHRLTPVLGLSERKDMIRDLEKGKSHCAYFLRDQVENQYIHGVKGDSIWIFAHDYFHTHKRIRNKILTDNGRKMINAFEQALKGRPPMKVQEVYQGYTYPQLAIGADIEDFATAIISELSGQYIDGESGMLLDFLNDENKFLECLKKREIPNVIHKLQLRSKDKKAPPTAIFDEDSREKAAEIAKNSCMKEVKKTFFKGLFS